MTPLPLPPPVTDDALRAAADHLADRFGTERAAAFSRRLPEVVRQLLTQWDLQVEGLYEPGATSVVLAVRSGSGALGVLKISPDTAFLHRQSAMLLQLAPSGRAPIVLASASEAGAVLLERVVPGTTLDSARSTPPSPAQWSELLRDLHSTPAAGIETTLEERCEEMYERIGARAAQPRVRAHVPAEAWQDAVRSCRELLRTGDEQVVIHGDLHLGNVLDGGERGLVVIDPKLCVGDPCFDMIDFVLVDDDPHSWTARAQALAPLVGLGTPLGLSRLLAWSRVNAVVTAVSRTAQRAPKTGTQTCPDARTAALLAFASGAQA